MRAKHEYIAVREREREISEPGNTRTASAQECRRIEGYVESDKSAFQMLQKRVARMLLLRIRSARVLFVLYAYHICNVISG